MPISPISAGDGRAWPNQVFTTDSSIFPLTGVANGSIALHLEDINNNYTLYICTGTWAVTNVGSVGPPVVPATATFTPSAADLLSTNPFGRGGVYKAYPVVTLSTGGVPMDSQILEIQVKP
jgi:hypothetical protein